MEREESTLPARSSSDIPHKELHQFIVMCQGGLCDPDFDLETHNDLFDEFYRWRHLPKVAALMDITCMGHNVPETIKEAAFNERDHAANLGT